MRWVALKRFCLGVPEYGLNVPAESYTPEGLRFIRTTDVTERGGLTPAEDAVFIDPNDADPSSRLQDGDLLFSRSGTLGRALLYRRGMAQAAFAGYLVRFRPRPENDPRYIYCSLADFFQDTVRSEAVSSTISNFNAERYANLRLPWCSLPEQRAIADFLDAETARIDALIAKKRRMYSAIEERFKSERDQQVRHLMAEHGSMAVRRLVDGVEQGWSPSCEDRTANASEWGVLKTSAVTEGTFKGAENKRLPDDLQPDLRWGVEDSDVLVARGSGSIKRVETAAAAAIEGQNLLISDLIYRLVRPRMKPALLAHCINSSVGRTHLESSIRTDVGQTLKIRGDDLLDTPVPSVPPKLQAKVLDAIEGRLHLARETVKRLAVQLALLAEHRQALITAAVTGQIEMSEGEAISR